MKKRTTILTALTLTGILLTGCATASSAAQINRIELDSAKSIAIKDAGFSEEDVKFVSAELDRRNGIEYYDIEFHADGKEYDYDIDALTGKVIGSETPAKPEDSSKLSETDAKKIALAQVPGAKESDIREFEVDYDDGRLEYEGSICYGEWEYDFEIDGYSGAIRNWEVESIYD